jgi:hypothetical protein
MNGGSSLSFLAFQMYHKVIRILQKRLSEVVLDISVCKITWMPSFSWGRVSVLIVGEMENHTVRGRWQWKNKWASSSIAPQVAQWSSMWLEYLAPLSAVDKARRISLQVKVLISGASCLIFQAWVRIWLACGSMLLEPCWGSSIVFWAARCL